MKLLVDMNLSPRWVAFLGDAGLDAKHWSAIGKATAPDSEIMAYARTNASIVLTHDLDFGSILAATRRKGPSVIQVRSENVTPEAIGNHVLNAIRQMGAELEQGALVTIDSRRARLRILPLDVLG